MKLTQLNEFRSCTTYWLNCCRTDFTVLIKCNKLLSLMSLTGICSPLPPNIMNFGWGGGDWGLILEFVTWHLTSNLRPPHSDSFLSPHKTFKSKENSQGHEESTSQAITKLKALGLCFPQSIMIEMEKNTQNSMYKELLISLKLLHMEEERCT